MISLLQAVNDPAIFAPHFSNNVSWGAWWTVAKAIFALRMNANDEALFTACSGRESPPTARAKETWLICGRRGGKSRFVSLLAVYLATFFDWTAHLAPGEKGHLVIIAADRRQCRVIMSYVRAFLIETPLLRMMVQREAAEEIELSNSIIVEVVTCSFKAVRGRTIIAALCDEAAFWSDEDGSNPASEVIAALRPAMATIPGSMLLVASSPYAKRGPLWDAFRKFYGTAGNVLVWRASTRTMNPQVAQDIIDEAYERDELSAKSEYGAEFRSDLDSYITRETIDELTVPGRHELPALGAEQYFAFVDPSGGSSDSMTLAVTHRAPNNTGVLDAVREYRPPFSPEAVVKDCAALLKTYDVTTVEGDRYAGEWTRERFREHGISYEPADRSKSDFYRDLLPIMNSGRCELLDHKRLAAQLCALERRTARSGRDSIDHGPGGHDDVANAVAGALVRACSELSSIKLWEALSD